MRTVAARTWRVGTRGSRLALAQTRWVIDRLQQARPQDRFETVVIRTTGDADRTRDLSQFETPGVFVKELERALLDGRVDVVVHSAKDVPTTGPGDLVIAAFPPRAWVHDVLVCRRTCPLDPVTRLPALPQGARIGTSSVRRRAQLAAWRPDLQVVSLRGNVDTRLGRVAGGDLDGAVLAAAGLARLGMLPESPSLPAGPLPLAGFEELCAWPLPLERFVPAPGQGALALQVRAGDEAALALARLLDDPATSLAVRAERAFLAGMGASCAVPIGAAARVDGDTMELLAYYAGAAPAHRRWTGPARLPEDLGCRAARAMLPGGGDAAGAREGRPMAGRRVLIPRPQHDAEGLAAEIRRRGGVPVVVPLIAVVPLADPSARDRLDQALRLLETCDWAAFTSRNAVTAVLERLRALGLAWPVGRVRVAAVGQGTAEPLQAAGIPVDLIPAEARWQGLAAELPAAAGPGARVLLPRSARAPDHLPRALRDAGLVVHEVPAYDTVQAPDAARRLAAAAAQGPLDAVVITSASAAEELAAVLAETGAGLESLGGGRRPLVACIGPNTAADARRAGLPVDAVPARPGLEPMLEALEQALAGR